MMESSLSTVSALPNLTILPGPRAGHAAHTDSPASLVYNYGVRAGKG